LLDPGPSQAPQSSDPRCSATCDRLHTVSRFDWAFQLERWLDLNTFSKLRQLYLRSGASDNLLWDFLQTRHSDLGGTTGVDFLLGFFDPKMAAMSFEDRTDHFLEIAQEDILGATQ